ncbi:uncharacterized protein LOC124893790 [Capsicum annuum]|uniref:uncharacterized protein LOC124893790 n=1 Tax=Capsicum annuum TaxID=4072 RepID=UPI001FB0D56E|nr:uncharacterized protein LOC124893790 [Capsicum annuum]XP_047260598.1 uncharacterized protein LOC124893790 [Capsicum annuum]
MNQEMKSQDQGHQSDRQNDPENPRIQDAIAVTTENQDKKFPAEGKGNGTLFPANYAIIIEFLKCLMKIVLLVLGIGKNYSCDISRLACIHFLTIECNNRNSKKNQTY